MHACMQDQLILFMALAEGESRMLCTEPTMHTRTAVAIVTQLLPGVTFSIEPAALWLDPSPHPSGSNASTSNVMPTGRGVIQEDQNHQQRGRGLWLIRCQGAGWRA